MKDEITGEGYSLGLCVGGFEQRADDFENELMMGDLMSALTPSIKKRPVLNNAHFDVTVE